MLIALALACAPAEVLAADAPTLDTSGPDKMLADYFSAETAKLRDACLTDIKTLDDWKQKREHYRQQLFEMLGLDPLPEKTDLKAVVTGTIDHNDFRVEKIHFQSRPGLYVTGNLYIPKGLTKPAPVVLYLCGHSQVKKNDISYGNKTAYQHHGAWFARHGYVCLVLDSLQLGEIEGIHHGTYRYDMWWWNCRGYCPAGVEAWNCIRALDYLQTRTEVDPNRIGVTGRSGGGAYSWWISALDDRITAAVPVAGITDLQNHVVDGCVEGHCDCMYIVNTYRWDYPLVAALMAPRPLLISNTDKDTIFPLDGVVRLHEKVRNIYRLFNADKSLGLQITEGPHKDTQELQIHALVWFNRFLKNEDSLIRIPAESWTEREQLRVFDKLPEDQINTKIHESFVAKAQPAGVPQNAQQWIDMRDAWLKALKEKCFRGWPSEEDASPLDVQRTFSIKNQDLAVAAYTFASQPHVRLPLHIIRPTDVNAPEKLIVFVVDEEYAQRWLGILGSAFAEELRKQGFPEQQIKAYQELSKDDIQQATTVIRQLLLTEKASIALIVTRGISPDAWNPDKKKQIQVQRRFMLLGQTVDGMRVWDVRRAIQTLRSIDSTKNLPITLTGRKTMAGVALYASLFEPHVSRLDLWHLPASHSDGPIFLNVLRFLDIPQALAMAAERCETHLHQNDAAITEFTLAVLTALGKPSTQFQVHNP